MCLVSVQFLSIFWDSVTWVDKLHYGRSPSEGLYPIPDTNDDPYSDRSFLCVLQGRSYVPMSVNEALSLGTTKIVDTTGDAVDGYRAVKREATKLVSEALDAYTTMCSVIAVPIDEILKTCSTPGYNMTSPGGNLRLMDDLSSNTMYEIPNSLPILILPVWDNALLSRSIIPGKDGSACMVRLDGSYLYPVNAIPVLKAVSRTVREAKTIEFLKRPGSRWKNSWYEDHEGAKWYSDIISSVTGATSQQAGFDFSQQEFKMHTGKSTCENELGCPTNLIVEKWGSTFSCIGYDLWMTSVTVANGERYGVFLYEESVRRTSKSAYNWETLLSNVYSIQLLLHWLVAMIALQRGYFLGLTGSDGNWYNIGISCLVNSTQFSILPVMLLLRMKMALFAFWSSGCQFGGQQQPFSVLNTLGRLLRFCICDKRFDVSVVLLYLLHFLRKQGATSGWFAIDDRISTVFHADELEELTLVQLMTTSVALRINRNVNSIFYMKITILAVNLVPVVLGRRNEITSHKELVSAGASKIKTVLAVRIRNVGGLGAQFLSSKRAISLTVSDLSEHPRALNQYELTRLGYLVYGNVLTDSEIFLITVDDWLLVTQLAPLRKLTNLWNHRVMVFPIRIRAEDRMAVLTDNPEVCRLDNSRLQEIRWWRFHIQPLALSGGVKTD